MAAELDDLHSEVHDFIRRNPRGVTVDDLAGRFPDLGKKGSSDVVNQLSAFNMIEFLQGKNKILFRAKVRDERTKGLSPNETIVYNYVSGSSDKGIWIKDIRSRSAMHFKVVDEAIKTLEKKSLIKAVKSVKFPTRKIYMLSNLTPSVELTGGIFFSDGVLDTGFTTSLSFPDAEGIYPSYYSNYMTVDDVLKDIKAKKIVKDANLSRGDVEAVIDVLVFSGKIYRLEKPFDDREIQEQFSDDENPRKRAKREYVKQEYESLGEGYLDQDGQWVKSEIFNSNEEEETKITWMYKATREYIPDLLKNKEIGTGKTKLYNGPMSWFDATGNAWTEIPCGKCPVEKYCSSDGPVNPKTCPYMSEWLAIDW
ncbi:34-kDa subunit of RNA polymerase III (C) [Nowakowskiella sp. JEL0078]|nr:34-kDa subunit of RNA polymerase III (C) [Nowakowskiella sp. JEL0078]